MLSAKYKVKLATVVEGDQKAYFSVASCIVLKLNKACIFCVYFTMLSAKYKVKLAAAVEGDQKAPFSIATTLRCRGRYSFPWVAPLYPWYVPYIAEC